ncbi:MAG: hypothetical protein JWP66_521 [Naasia sp.]|nr:hypothetical protein [Naasia sp.]
MSDDLEVRGGGRITIADDELLAALTGCARIADRLDDAAARLARSDALPEARRVAAAADRLHLLAGALRFALDAYSAAEYAAGLLAARAAAILAYWAGRLSPLLLLTATGPAVPLAAILAYAAYSGTDPVWRRDVARALLTDPRIAGALRVGVDGVDDALRGSLQLPAHLAQGLEHGVLGRGEAALLLLLGLRAADVVSTGRPAVSQVAAGPARPPSSLADLAARVPPTGGGAPQVRIERYATSTGTRFAVYLGGTATVKGTDPWDLGSDVAGMSSVPADSVVAATDAMRAAGIGPADPVVLVGYSQGGLIASRIAEGGGFRIDGVLALASPSPASAAPTLSLEHADDPVPALAGAAPPPPGTVIVRRTVYDDAPPPRTGPLAAGHALETYRETAARADSSAEERIVAARSVLLDGLRGATGGTATLWRADRGPG